MNRNQFTFYKSFDDTFEILNDKQALLYLKTLRDVQFLRVKIQDVSFSDVILKAIWQSTKHTLETSIKGYLDSQLSDKVANPFFGCYIGHSKSKDPFSTPSTPPNKGVSRQDKEESKEEDKDKDKLKEQAEAIYQSYPTRCSIRNSSTGKNSSDKKKLIDLIKTHDYDYVDRAISFYVKDCKKSETMLKNFSTLLNNLPEPPEYWGNKKIPAKLDRQFVDNSGNSCADYVDEKGNVYHHWMVEPSEVRGEFFVKEEYVKQ